MMKERSLVEMRKLWRHGWHDVASKYLGKDVIF